MRTPLVLVGLLPLVTACEFAFTDPSHIGRRCSDEDACPQGQKASADGQCLEPCTVAGCTGSDCGCSGLVNLDDEQWTYATTCQDDGLCHFTCDQQSCPQEMRCVDGVLCLPACPDGWCPEGRTCASTANPDDAYCLASGS